MNSELRTRIDKLIKEREITYLSFKGIAECGVFNFGLLVPLMEQVYRTYYTGDFRMPKSDYLKYDGRSNYDRIITLLGYLGGEFNLSGVKQICSSTLNQDLGLPRASGLIILNDVSTQRPFAILEASQISAARTAAVTGLAIQWLAKRPIKKMAFLGCGYLARVHLQMWNQLYSEDLKTVHVFDKKADAMDHFVTYADGIGMKAIPCQSAEAALAGADLIVPMTTEETPYVEPDWVTPGALYSAVSLLDAKIELLKHASVIVVDDLESCKHEGRPLQLLDEAGELNDESLFSMGEIVSRDLRIRGTESDVVFFNPMGTVLTDLAVAGQVLWNSLKKGNSQQFPV